MKTQKAETCRFSHFFSKFSQFFTSLPSTNIYIYIYMIMSYSCRKYQMISRNFSRCNERYDHHYTSTFVNSCIKICRKQQRKKYWDRCESYPGRMKRLVLLFITLFSGLSLSRPCKEQENIFDPLRKFENYLELFYTPVFCLV